MVVDEVSELSSFEIFSTRRYRNGCCFTVSSLWSLIAHFRGSINFTLWILNIHRVQEKSLRQTTRYLSRSRYRHCSIYLSAGLTRELLATADEAHFDVFCATRRARSVRRQQNRFDILKTSLCSPGTGAAASAA